ncbi:hypothetical protein [Phenylobacterium sp.]|uniref:hypothetical protein n=1 Tax=Phenylobacterium sp. TaxID=1871053 RepID=UPI00261096BE|nr:hypothetical protein [Phenylobacterium sp.]
MIAAQLIALKPAAVADRIANKRAALVGGGIGALLGGPAARLLEGQAKWARRAFALMVMAAGAYVAWRASR